jgi:hypothetical protein
MSSIHEQARAEAEKRFPDTDPLALALAMRDVFQQGYLAGHEAASRPRQVTTVAELDALPVGSVVLSEQGAIWERESDAYWIETGNTWRVQSEDIALPARVLYVPEEES